MTSGACQLGEPQSTTNSLASRALPVVKRQVVVEHRELAVADIRNETDEQEIGSGDQQRQQNRQQERTSSESSDSGQLSLVSSFGSLSIGGYQLNNSANRNNTSNDSASHLSADTEQHHFYCSLMLLNSLDFYHYGQTKSEQQQQQQQLSSPQLQSSSITDLDTKQSLDNCHESLLDCRAHWFACKQSGAIKEKSISNQSALLNDNIGKTKDVKAPVEESKKKKSSFGVLGVNWQGQKAGKFVAAAAAATNSVSFVDKLLAHMVKKSGSGSINRTTTSQSSTNFKHVSSKSQKQETMNSSGGGSQSSSPPTIASAFTEHRKQKATNSSGVGSSIHLLSDLSRRLARHCGVKTKAAPMDGSAKHVASNEGVYVSCLSLKRDSSGGKWRQTLPTGPESAISEKNNEQQLKTNSSEQHTSEVSNSDCNPDFNQSQLSINTNANISKASQLPLIASLAIRSKVNITNSVNKLIEDQHRQVQQQSNNNSNNNDITSNNHLYASISTLNTTPSNCCLCDNETCSSSGFVSSSTTTTGGGGGGGGGGAGSNSSSGCSRIDGANSCVNGINGLICDESTTTTHSCNSSTYNEPIPNIASSPKFGYSHSYSFINTSDSSRNNNQSQVNTCCWPSPQREKQQQAHQPKHHCDRSILTICKEQNNIINSENRGQIGMASLGQVSTLNNISQTQLSQPVATLSVNIESIGNQQEQQQQQRQPSTMTEIQIIKTMEEQGDGDHNKSSSSTHNDQSGDGLLKPKTSLLARARNSTINLASLATVTNKFNCSASVGNLWHGNGNQHHNNQIEVADNSAADGIRPIDYITSGGFDSYHPEDDSNRARSPAKEPDMIKSSSSNKLLSVASCGSTRKLATKEKGKRQKDAERVEKLRLLVSYLKSGSSQPVVSPVALEADEIELAERYKLHMMLRDDLHREIQSGDQQHRQQNQLSLLDSTKVTDESANDKQLSIISDGSKNPLISHSIGGTTTSSPASSSSGSMNHAHSTNDGRSIPHIGNVTWVLRHSISDPGNNFEHSPAFSSASSSQHHPSHQHHHRRHHHHHHQQHPNQHDVDVNVDHSFNPTEIHNQSDCINCESCAQGTSYSGSSLNNYSICSTISKSNPKQQQQQTISNQQKSPKLFYIDDMDSQHASTPNGPLVVPITPTFSTITTQPLSSELGSAISNYCSQPATPAISTTSSGEESNRNSNTSAWSNPQNLATWIDNEVNSLVNDLEAKSQLLLSKSESKQSKSGKRKWLSVTSASIRRNSSGAQST